MMQIGGIYEEQGFYEEALETYEKAREIDYYNNDILRAIEEAKAAREEGRLRASTEIDRYHSLRYRDFSYTPGSYIGERDQLRREQIDSRGGVLQVLPYLGMMLADQFMQLRHRGGDEE